MTFAMSLIYPITGGPPIRTVPELTLILATPFGQEPGRTSPIS